MSAFQQPPMPGYSPWFAGRQDSPFLLTPGAQGLQEGVSQGQGLGFSPQAEFFSGGTEGSAPPSSIAKGGADMWGNFGGSGGAPSSAAQGQMAPARPSIGGMGNTGAVPTGIAAPAPGNQPTNTMALYQMGLGGGAAAPAAPGAQPGNMVAPYRPGLGTGTPTGVTGASSGGAAIPGVTSLAPTSGAMSGFAGAQGLANALGARNVA